MIRVLRQIGSSRNGVWTAATLFAMLSVTAPSFAATPAKTPSAGMLLVASRTLVDGGFAGSVVLLTRYSAGGAMGLVVNRPIGIRPQELLTDVDKVKDYEGELYGGGPVAIHSVFMLIRSSETPQSAQHIFADVYASHSRDLLQSLSADRFSRELLRFYAGYAGWGAGQLDAEIARGDWHLVAPTTDAIFGSDPGEVWEKLLPPPPSIIAANGPAYGEATTR